VRIQARLKPRSENLSDERVRQRETLQQRRRERGRGREIERQRERQRETEIETERHRETFGQERWDEEGQVTYFSLLKYPTGWKPLSSRLQST
jgi:hypothetical protein